MEIHQTSRVTDEGGDIVSGPVTIKGKLSTSQEKRGFVAFLDVLGFLSLVGSGAERLVEYGGIVETSLDDPRIESVVFSDSIIITKEGRDPERLRTLCAVARK
jgi:hypothetical protein